MAPDNDVWKHQPIDMYNLQELYRKHCRMLVGLLTDYNNLQYMLHKTGRTETPHAEDAMQKKKHRCIFYVPLCNTHKNKNKKYEKHIRRPYFFPWKFIFSTKTHVGFPQSHTPWSYEWGALPLRVPYVTSLRQQTNGAQKKSVFSSLLLCFGFDFIIFFFLRISLAANEFLFENAIKNQQIKYTTEAELRFL